MAGFGNLLLNLLGNKDPTDAAVGQLLGASSLGARPGTRTPGGALPMGGAGTAATAPQPQAYTTPPDLMEMYTELRNRSRKETMLDRGFGLLASSFAQPENREFIMSSFGGGGETAAASDPLSLVTSIAEAQNAAVERENAAAEKQRQIAALPAIAEQYGLDETTARLLMDNDQLDDYVMEKSKYREADTETITQSDGTIHLISKNDGSVIKSWGGTGSTEDEQLYNADMADRAKRGQPNIPMAQWLQEQANLKRSQTTINNNMGPQADAALLAGLDTNNLETFNQARNAVGSIEKIQQARRALEGGIIAGDVTAPVRLETLKLASSLFGLPNEAAANTEAFQSSMKEIVLPLVKQLGTGNSISNADREFVEKAIGGSITLTEGAMRRILSIMERGQRNEIMRANKRMEERVANSAVDSPLRKAFAPIQVPVLSEAAAADLVDSIPPGHIRELVDNANVPEAIAEFDSMYGAGAAEIVLGMQ